MCSRKEMCFSVFVLHHLAKQWNVSPAKVYKILDETHILGKQAGILGYSIAEMKAYNVPVGTKHLLIIE